MPIKNSGTANTGITMVELAIVITILGLLIGGVLAGKALIESAEIKNAVQQIARLDTAVSGFRSRYNGLPGDLMNARSQMSTTSWTSLANGDGNGILTDSGGGTNSQNGELSQFWYHLSASGIVDERYDNSALVESGFPMLKVGQGSGIGVYGDSTNNYYHIGLRSNSSGTAIATSNALTSDQASMMDGKLDDGMPKTGRVIAKGGTAFNGVPTYYSSSGAIGGDTDSYIATQSTSCITKTNTASVADANATAIYSPSASGLNCQLRIDFP